MNRRLARETCMQILFEMNINKNFDKRIADRFINDELYVGNQKEYIKSLIDAFLNNKENIDDLLKKVAVSWEFDRIAKVDLAILRLAVTEINYLEDIPVNVSINEALELGKKFSTDDSSSFINGILGKLVEKGE
ncbi:transcription antitermination factor NusB [Serpentinicella sp. ANB-PHB4]|uniref:transcription antitermination factor NusB n=1 Tax=Serpentinicella sp. ANB-PHB4 TaxID=3074076 RepID=UPI00285A283E|nr:transcription antitermination factor NusB [Serpentinicella sp. ANB-PHB4]MDR5658191.1 transcription antitermination factor NusB [Serpentinicella sp. ANB-PHB4]